MKRILLVMEDLNEQNFIEILLKKISFDVLSTRKFTILNETVMSFRPDVVIANGESKKINGEIISKGIKVKGLSPKLILLYSINQAMDKKITAKYSCDAIIESPINTHQLIYTLCKVADLDEKAVMSKYEKLPIAQSFSDPDNELKIVKSKQKDSKKSGRAKQYEEYLKTAPKSNLNGFEKSKINVETKKIRDYEKDHPDLEELDKQRKKFVSALFKK
jgi:hypothetical protein